MPSYSTDEETKGWGGEESNECVDMICNTFCTGQLSVPETEDVHVCCGCPAWTTVVHAKHPETTWIR